MFACRCLLAGIVSALAVAVPESVRACSCAQVSVETAAAEASALFEGRVISIRPDTQGVVRIRATVVRKWRGAETETVDLLTASSGARCGYGFRESQSYLIYAHSQPSGDLGVSLCSRTRPIEEAGEDLAFLGEGVVPVNPTVEDPEYQAPRATTDPGAGGCASCAIAARRVSAHPGLALVLCFLLLQRRSLGVGARLNSRAPA
jgi:hypothetical protein